MTRVRITAPLHGTRAYSVEQLRVACAVAFWLNLHTLILLVEPEDAES